MIYIIDHNSLITIFTYYYRSRFKSFWDRFDNYVLEKKIISVREIYQEILHHQNGETQMGQWAKKYQEIFLEPTPEEMGFVTSIFKVEHFQQSISKKNQYEGKPVADPFLIAKAKTLNGCVITEEKFKPHAAKIPNICKYFNVNCTDLENFMKIEDWVF